MQFQKARGSGVLTGAPSGRRIDEAVTQRRPPGGWEQFGLGADRRSEL